MNRKQVRNSHTKSNLITQLRGAALLIQKYKIAARRAGYTFFGSPTSTIELITIDEAIKRQNAKLEVVNEKLASEQVEQVEQIANDPTPNNCR